MNVMTFLAFAVDKRKAQKRKWRLSTKTLMGLSILGGAGGGFVAMHVFRHKTKQRKYLVGIPSILIIQTIGLLYFVLQHYSN